MGLLGKVIKTGIAAGAAYAAVKIGEKYKGKNPTSDPEKTMDAFKEAANEFYKETSAAVKDKAPGVIETVKEKANEAYEFAKEKAPGATSMAEDLYNKAAEAAPSVIETVKEKANEAYGFAKEKAPEATAKAEEFISKAKDFVSSLDETPVDGEVVEFEEPGESAAEEEKTEETEAPAEPEVEKFEI